MSKVRILVVEDESIVALDLQDRLQEIGYSVPAIARTGEQAIKKVHDTQPDLILMDINLAGEIDGIEAATRIRQSFDIPVIFLTAFSDRPTLDRARDAGPYGYIIKPFEIESAHSAIEMAVNRHVLELQIRASEIRYRRLYEQSNDAIIIHSLGGTIQDINGRACEMLGHDRETLLQTKVLTLHPEEEHETVGQALQILAERGATQYESRFQRSDGTLIIVDISASVFDREKGLVQAIARDMTERVNAAKTLVAQKVELEARNEELDAYAHTVAHDLKGPLGLIVGYAQLMELELGGESDAIMAKGIRVIAKQSLKMNDIIEALLMLAGVRDAEVEIERLDMQGIVDEVLIRLKGMIQATQAEIVLPASWPEALGYPLWVEEIWVNYLNNAIKYGGSPPRLELGASAVPNNGSDPSTASQRLIRFWVKDNGLGLTAEEQTRLFTPFTRLYRAPTAGHGLGLSIVQRIATKLGGRAQVSSDGVPGQGSTFSFSLPAAKAPERLVTPDEVPALAAGPGSRSTVR